MGPKSRLFVYGVTRRNGDDRSNVAVEWKSLGGQFGFARDSEFESYVAATIELFGK